VEGTVKQAPGRLKKQAEQKALENPTKVKVPKVVGGVKEKLPKVKVKKNGNGAVISPPVELPPTQLPVGPTGLQAPTGLPLLGP
jgi:hypothetical protein